MYVDVAVFSGFLSIVSTIYVEYFHNDDRLIFL